MADEDVAGSDRAVLGDPHATGLTITKTCPPSVQSGATFQCTFTIHNHDEAHGIANLVVTNQVPYGGGPISPVACYQNGVPVTSLGPKGTPTDSCSGTIDEKAPINRRFWPVRFLDQLTATGEDAGLPGLAVSAWVVNGPLVESLFGTLPIHPGTDLLVSLARVSMTFPKVTREGTVTVAMIDPTAAGELPPGYAIPEGGFACEITMTAETAGEIVVAFDVPEEVDLAAFDSLRILHGEGGKLVDRTELTGKARAQPKRPNSEPGSRTISTRLRSLGMFVLARRMSG